MSRNKCVTELNIQGPRRKPVLLCLLTISSVNELCFLIVLGTKPTTFCKIMGFDENLIYEDFCELKYM
jgi:hypothetical protein